MGSLLRRIVRILNLRAAKHFANLEERRGWAAATGTMLLYGAFVGVYAVWLSYGLIMLWAWLQTRRQDPMLVMMFLMAWFLLGAVQGAWLGSAIGYSVAMHLRKRAWVARVACFINSLLFLLLEWALLNLLPTEERWFAFAFISFLPTVAAIVMLAWSIVPKSGFAPNS